ncbi:MAG: hypothetical protein GXO82_06115 [Chlorobi bacterium]|nr:hypothetical protein [Chlorobiota bacterium]
MKPIALVFLIIFCMLNETVMSQDEAPVSRRPRGPKGVVGAGIGAIPMWFHAGTSEINLQLRSAHLPEFSNSGMFLMGGAAYAYILAIDNLRVGAMLESGSTESNRVVNELYQSVTYDVNFIGGTVEYSIPFGNFVVSLGGLIGGGANQFTLVQSPNVLLTWKEILDQYKSIMTDSQSHVFTQSTFVYAPWVTAEYIINPFITFRVAGGYLGMVGGTWTTDNRFEVLNMPELKLGNTFIQLGVFVGAFLSR